MHPADVRRMCGTESICGATTGLPAGPNTRGMRFWNPNHGQKAIDDPQHGCYPYELFKELLEERSESWSKGQKMIRSRILPVRTVKELLEER
jgi:hypothetical protein